MLRLRPFFIAENICTHRIGAIQGVCVSCDQPVEIQTLKFDMEKRRIENDSC